MLTVHYEAAGDWARAEESARAHAQRPPRPTLAVEDAVRAYRVAVAAAASRAAGAGPPARASGRRSVA